MDQNLLLFLGLIILIAAPFITLIRYFLGDDRQYHYENEGYRDHYPRYDPRYGRYQPDYYEPDRRHYDPDDDYYDDEYHRRYSGRYRRRLRDRNSGAWMFLTVVAFLIAVVFLSQRQETIVVVPPDEVTAKEKEAIRNAFNPKQSKAVTPPPQVIERQSIPSYPTSALDYQVYGRSYLTKEQARAVLQDAANAVNHQVHFGEKDGMYILFIQANNAVEQREILRHIESQGKAARKYFHLVKT
jgi:hypothetical protein